MADIFDTDPVSLKQMNAERLRLWELIRKTENLVWQLLTKRPEGYTRFLPMDLLNHARVWKGVTCEDQPAYELRWGKMDLPGLTWISYEPAVGPLNLKLYPWPDWVVCGGESGHNRREFMGRWGRVLQAQCEERGIAFFMKQWSAATPTLGKALIPADLMIQEFPGLK